MPSKPHKPAKPLPAVPMDALSGVARLHDEAARFVSQHLREREQWHEERGRLIDEKTWLRAIIDEVPDYLFVKDAECRFIVANRSVAADMGRDPVSIIGATDADLHPPARAQEFLADDRRVIATGQAMIDKEEFIIRPTGEMRWLSTSKVPLRDPDGATVGLVGVARDITLRKQAEEQVRFLAFCDPLTRLPNRASFEENLLQVAHALEPGEEARLMLVDLDRFKQVNDTLGHAAGDELLRQVSGRLTTWVGGRGQVSRLGGDEFVILMAFQSAHEETAFYRHVVDGLAEFSIMGSHIYVGASMGISKIHGATTPLVALREADIALYDAKAKGRNCWQIFEVGMADELERRHQLELDLRDALLEGDQFVLHYQLIFDDTGSRIVGAEALVRWQHPQRGLLGPEQFIPLAEDRGLIVQLGDLVFRRASELLARTDLAWVAINVSPSQLRDPGFPDRSLHVLKCLGVDASRIQLEITEGVVLQEFDQVRPVFERLRRAGMRVAIDDFGTGYSSLSYLGQLTLDKIKIDRSFVQAIGTSSGNAIVCAVIAFAKALNMSVTAEGVETAEQQAFLQNAACNELQGYLLARPEAEEGLSAMTGMSRTAGLVREY